jgi:hypothetical protein
MLTMDEIMALTPKERSALQKGFVRNLAIGLWTPRGPLFMGMLRNTLLKERGFSSAIVTGILDRIAGMAIYTDAKLITYSRV